MAESPEALEKTLTALWDGRDDLFAVLPEADARAAILQSVELLDTGEARVAEVVDGEVVVHEWLKYAVLLLFRISLMETIELGPFEYADKIPLKRHFQRQGVRVVPGASARWGSYLAPGAVMMPSYVTSVRASAPTRWSTPGPRWVRVRRSVNESISPGAWASGACWSRRRPRR
jgi:2,3,4,5-tetrahydropyridine-2-carboxylate N-succinyltransferase